MTKLVHIVRKLSGSGMKSAYIIYWGSSCGLHWGPPSSSGVQRHFAPASDSFRRHWICAKFIISRSGRFTSWLTFRFPPVTLSSAIHTSLDTKLINTRAQIKFSRPSFLSEKYLRVLHVDSFDRTTVVIRPLLDLMCNLSTLFYSLYRPWFLFISSTNLIMRNITLQCSTRFPVSIKLAGRNGIKRIATPLKEIGVSTFGGDV